MKIDEYLHVIEKYPNLTAPDPESGSIRNPD